MHCSALTDQPHPRIPASLRQPRLYHCGRPLDVVELNCASVIEIEQGGQ